MASLCIMIAAYFVTHACRRTYLPIEDVVMLANEEHQALEDEQRNPLYVETVCCKNIISIISFVIIINNNLFGWVLQDMSLAHMLVSGMYFCYCLCF